MFSYREFLKQGFLAAVGRLPDDFIILNSSGYYDKLILLAEDLEEIQNAINEKNARLEAERLAREQAAAEAERLAEAEAKNGVYSA